MTPTEAELAKQLANTAQTAVLPRPIEFPISQFAFDMMIAIAIALLFQLAYARYGPNPVQRRRFSRNFALFALTTFLIVSVVKTSLALSLGMVGALSIIRFRAAIKEPEELVALFMMTALGIGLGAGQRLITVVGIAVATGIFFLQLRRADKASVVQSLLTLRAPDPNTDVGELLTSAIRAYSPTAEMIRLERNTSGVEATVRAHFASDDAALECLDALNVRSPELALSLVRYQTPE